MLSIETIIDGLLLIVVAYLLVHQRAANAYELATYRILPALNIPLMLREFIGACLRRYHKLPTYSALDSAYEVLGLSPESATSDLVRERYFQLRAEMNKAPRAYPDSQHEAVFNVCWELGTQTSLRADYDWLRTNLTKFPQAPTATIG